MRDGVTYNELGADYFTRRHAERAMGRHVRQLEALGFHVTVTSPFGTIPWLRLSRFDDDEMKQLMIDIVDRTYQLLHALLDEHTGRDLLSLLGGQDPAPRWNAPRLPDVC